MANYPPAKLASLLLRIFFLFNKGKRLGDVSSLLLGAEEEPMWGCVCSCNRLIKPIYPGNVYHASWHAVWVLCQDYTLSVFWEAERFHLLWRVCILEIKQIDNIKENFLRPFNKCAPILVILWEFKHLTQQMDQGAILFNVDSLVLYVTKWFTARDNFWNCYLALLKQGL